MFSKILNQHFVEAGGSQEVGKFRQQHKPDADNRLSFLLGWTLQELIAPSSMYFFSKNWKCLGDKSALYHLIEQITKIPESVLRLPRAIHNCSFAEKMSWAAFRRTTRKEDIAYCLLGIVNVNMPLLYGEGSNAFRRLQEEIIKKSSDHSILAWRLPKPQRNLTSALAMSPDRFADWPEENWQHLSKTYLAGLKDRFLLRLLSLAIGIPFQLTNEGLQITLAIYKCSDVLKKRYKEHSKCKPACEVAILVCVERLVGVIIRRECEYSFLDHLYVRERANISYPLTISDIPRCPITRHIIPWRPGKQIILRV